MHPIRPRQSGCRGYRRGFSLVELITVMAIIVIMAGLLGPAIKSISSNAGRKGALNTLMNTFEQARAASLESGANVYVVLWQRAFPENDSLLVLREPVEWNEKETKQYEDGSLIQLSRYIKMPQGILFYGGRGKSLFVKEGESEGISDLDMLMTQLPKQNGIAPRKSEIGYVKFTPTGTIEYPDKDHSRLIISEGVRDGSGVEARIADSKNSKGGLEIITFRRFVGRASVDVSTIE